jgi:hypothetical protein
MKKSLLLLIVIISCFSSKAIPFQQLWTLSADKEVSAPGERILYPISYSLAKLNSLEFKQLQLFIPTEESGQYNTISLPTPSGVEMEFNIQEVSMMEKPLADKYPMIKTYTAISKVNPMITAKLDFTLFGFHAKVFNGSETYFIDPYTDINSDWYIIYYKNQYAKPIQHRMHCDVDKENELSAPETAIDISGNTLPQNSYKQNGTNKRNYRLALACTMEYSTAVGGANPTKASVLSAMVTSMNRVNGVFEREFSMHATLVANNDTLIYLPGGTDPYTNNNGSTMLGQNQTTVNARIGSANYDYGHVFSTGGGGIASLGSVCSANSKAQGVTGSPNPLGDPFDIDYVAHEMGHQFGGSHTFNSITGSCSGNRSGTSAYEIGSATTIQGYAGICGNDNIQNNSDDYYHIRSLEQMTGTNVMACAQNTASNNALPTLNPIDTTYIIPYKTPFELTASGVDTDNDPLTYCWEEYDRGGSGAAWDAVTTVAPIFRSFDPSTSRTRTIPQRSQLMLNVESYKGEVLSVNQRIVRFRCTLRDMHNGYGAFYTSTDTLKLDVRTTTGLYRVTSQNTNGVVWTGSSPQTVTWDVAGTNAAPFNCANVDIFVSTDSGKTWPHVLATNVPNNGTANVLSPNVDALGARIKVKGAGNVFFDLNDNYFRINKINYPAGLNEITENQVSVFPNPTKGVFTIEIPSELKSASVQVVNNVGAIVFESSIESKATISLPTISKGVYFVKIKSANNKQLVKKIIVE